MHGPISNGTRVLVQWSDGRSYRGVVSASHNGYIQVRWDAGGNAWVPAAYVRPEAVAGASQTAAPPAAAWEWQPAPAAAGAASAQAALPVQAAQAAQAAPPAQAAQAAQAAPPAQAAAQGSPSALAAALGSYPATSWEWQQPGAQSQRAPSPSSIRQPSASTESPVSSAAPTANAPDRISQSLAARPMQGAASGELPRGLVYEPTGAANGKVFFIFFGYVSLLDGDIELRSMEIDQLGDAVASLRAAGFRVVVDLHGDRTGLELALRSEHPDAGGAASAGVYWSSHGHDEGSVGDHEGRRIAPEDLAASLPLTIAQRGSLRLFVLSARAVSKHSERWHNALGPQVEISGWDAPHERSGEPLGQSEASARGLVEILERQLGVARLSAAGPLGELKELSDGHAARLTSLKLNHEELVKRAVEWLKAEVQPGKRRETYVTIAVLHRAQGAQAGPPAEQQTRLQTVRVTPRGAQDQSVHLMSIIGPYSEALDLSRALRELVDAMRTRIAIVKLSPQEPEFVVAEAFVLRRGLDPITLGKTIAQVGYVADRLEALFFGIDQY